ncbi:MAG: hypothetical protein ACFFG0_06270 [Candidatus Thorarchaeota archaeon]
MQRLANESFEDYKKRRRNEKIRIKNYLKGESHFRDECYVEYYEGRNKGGKILRIKPGSKIKRRDSKLYQVGNGGNLIKVNN